MLTRVLILLAVLLPSVAWAQQPPAMLSIEYYQQRIMETDARAAALTYENARLKAELDALRKAQADKKPDEKK